MQKENWTSIFGGKDLNSSFNSFYNKFLYHFEENFPIQKFFNKKSKGWVNQAVKLSSKNLRYLFRLKNYDPELGTMYKIAKKEHHNLIEETKRIYYQTKISNCDNPAKSVWHTVNTLNNKKKT